MQYERVSYNEANEVIQYQKGTWASGSPVVCFPFHPPLKRQQFPMRTDSLEPVSHNAVSALHGKCTPQDNSRIHDFPPPVMYDAKQILVDITSRECITIPVHVSGQVRQIEKKSTHIFFSLPLFSIQTKQWCGTSFCCCC